MYQATNIKYILHPWLRGYGQLIFLPHHLAGVAVLLAIAVNSPQMLFGALLAGTSATVIGWRFGTLEDYADGIYGVNGALLGIACAMFLQVSVLLWLWLVVAGGASAYIVYLARLRNYQVLTMPFMLLTAVSAICFAHLNIMHTGLSITANSVPLLSGVIASFGQMAFQGNLLAGLIIMLVLALINWQLLLATLLISVIVNSIAYIVGFSSPVIATGVLGFNAILTMIALSVLFEEPPTLIWSALTILLSIFLTLIAYKLGFVVFTLPFVLSIWWYMYIHHLKQN